MSRRRRVYDEVSDVEAHMSQLLSEQIAPGSRKTYASPMVEFLEWLHCHRPALLGDEFQQAISAFLDQEEARTRIIKSYISTPFESRSCPIRIQELSASVFMSWVTSLRKPNGDMLGQSAYATKRTALFNLARDFRASHLHPQTFESDLKGAYKALNRRISKKTQEGELDIKVGKDPLRFDFYRFLSRRLLHSKADQHIFAHTMMVLSWNLMSRVSNSASICYAHMSWEEDSLAIKFAHMKNDQCGDRPRDARHVYANPLMPEICPILAPGIYLCWRYDTCDRCYS